MWVKTLQIEQKTPTQALILDLEYLNEMQYDFDSIILREQTQN